MRIQRPVKGGRTRVSSSLAKKIQQRVEQECARYDVSKSFVVANALAFAFGIPIEDTYTQVKFTAQDLKRGKLIKPEWVRLKKNA